MQSAGPLSNKNGSLYCRVCLLRYASRGMTRFFVAACARDSFGKRRSLESTGVVFKPPLVLNQALQQRSTAGTAEQRRRSQRPAKILEAIQAFLDHVNTGGVTQAHGPIVAECSARHDCNIGLAEQTIGEILRG